LGVVVVVVVVVVEVSFKQAGFGWKKREAAARTSGG